MQIPGESGSGAGRSPGGGVPGTFGHHGIGMECVRGTWQKPRAKPSRGQVTRLPRARFTFTRSEMGVGGGPSRDATSPDMFR